MTIVNSITCCLVSKHYISKSFIVRFSHNKLTVELPIFKFTVQLLNFSSAFSPRKKASPKYKLCDRFLTIIGAINIGFSMFSKIMKNGLVLPITCMGCPETAVPALSVQGVIENFNFFASFSEQMAPNKFPLSTSVFINVLLISVPVYPNGICFNSFRLFTYQCSSETFAVCLHKK